MSVHSRDVGCSSRSVDLAVASSQIVTEDPNSTASTLNQTVLVYTIDKFNNDRFVNEIFDIRLEPLMHRILEDVVITSFG